MYSDFENNMFSSMKSTKEICAQAINIEHMY